MSDIPTQGAEVSAPARSVATVHISECRLDEPMVLSLRRRAADGTWKKGDRTFACWRDAIQAAYKVCCVLDPKSAQSDSSYMQPFKDGSYAPKTPWWVRADEESITFIWPLRMYKDYLRRLSVGTAHPLPGDESLFRPNADQSGYPD